MNQLQKYTWLIDTIRRAGKNSHKDLSDKWERNKALLLYMAVKGLTPDGEFQSCHSVVTGFIKQYGNFFCDSIDKTREALYSLAHKWEFSHPYVENGGDVGVLYEDKDGILRQTEGANMRYVRCRLSITGLNYVNRGNFIAHFERRKHVPCFMCLIKDNY